MHILLACEKSCVDQYPASLVLHTVCLKVGQSVSRSDSIFYKTNNKVTLTIQDFHMLAGCVWDRLSKCEKDFLSMRQTV